ncbi:hypothetical protein [Kutzneria sp. NPDC052558]|uniref:hypothetical protein n=1 Tax=Kutzneria sp. NPDC052558 TaxID=3364121 RepID=UPI0037CC0A76
MSKKSKRPVVRESIVAGRQPYSPASKGIQSAKMPRHVFEPQESDSQIVIRMSRIDTAGPWCLSKIDPGEHSKMLGRLKGLESMTVMEVFASGEEPGKHYEIAGCPSRAMVDRLTELGYDDETRISRLRFGGRGRLYGFMRRNHFYALWWDPEHEIWPSKLRNT